MKELGTAPADESAMRKHRFGLLRTLVAGLIGMMLALAAPAPAQANLSDCINAVAPVGDAVKAGELAGKLGACLGQASTGAGAVVAASIVALVAAGVIPANTDQCDAVINSVIGKLVAQALKDAGGGGYDPDKLQGLIDGTVSLTDIPGLGELLSCGCTIAGAPGEAEAIASEYMGSVKGCLDFFEDAAKWFLNGVEDIGEFAVCDVMLLGLDCAPANGGDTTCYNGPTLNCNNDLMDGQSGQCPQNVRDIWTSLSALPWGSPLWVGTAACNQVGYQCRLFGDRAMSCADIPHAIGVIPGRCTCAAPYTGRYAHEKSVGYTGCPGGEADWLYQCACDPPNVVINGQCACPPPLVLKDGVCQPCSGDTVYYPTGNASGTGPGCMDTSNFVCPPGTKQDATTHTCVGACNASIGEYFDSGSCKQCPAGSHVVYASNNLQGGPGHCEPSCQPGQILVETPVPATTTGPPGQHPSGVQLSCGTCPPNTRAIYDNASTSAGHCEACPNGTYSNGNAIECQTLYCGSNGYVDPNNQHACKYCPTGQVYYPQGSQTITVQGPQGPRQIGAPAHCGCPQDQRLVGNQCQCPAGSYVSFTGGPTYTPGSSAACHCPIGAHIDEATWSCQCPAGATLEPGAARCQCPAGQQLVGNVCATLKEPGAGTYVVPPPDVHALPSGSALPALPKTAANCPALGPRFIRNSRDASACIKCPAGRIANSTLTACVLAPRAPSVRVRRPSVRAPPSTHEPIVRVPPNVREPIVRMPPPSIRAPIGRTPPPTMVRPPFGGRLEPHPTPHPRGPA